MRGDSESSPAWWALNQSHQSSNLPTMHARIRESQRVFIAPTRTSTARSAQHHRTIFFLYIIRYRTIHE